MDRAWKVMLPLGLVNLLVVAFLVEFNAPWWLQAAVGWATFFAAMIGTALINPFDRRGDSKNVPVDPQVLQETW